MRRAPRRLTVLASLDVAGYTRLIEDDERGTLVALARIRRSILRPSITRNRGDLFKTMGDGALVEFQSVEDAVEWAIEFQTAMAEFNANRKGPPIRVRVGVALADIFVQGNDRFGKAVGFVVRLQQSGPPGGIAITHSVRWQLVRTLAAQFERKEWVELKGMDEQYEIWTWLPPSERAVTPIVDSQGIGRRSPPSAAVSLESEITAEAPAVAVAPPLAPISTPAVAAPADGRPSIAVLAFDNMSGDPNAESIADGIVEEITATLSRVRDFTVIARNSSYAYKGRAKDVREVSRELGARYVLEGSLRKAGERVRVTAQLIDAASGAHLWADSYDGVIDNLFDFEDQIAERVAGAVYPSIRAAEIALARRKRPDNLVAYDLVLRALPHLWAHRRDDNAEAIRLLDEARRLDPFYARATAVAAWARAQHVVYNWSADIDAARTEGRQLIDEAANQIGDDPMALTALATATTLLLGDLDRAGHLTDRALALDPNNAWAWTRRGFITAYKGDAEAAMAAFERAAQLSPLDPFSFNSYIGLGFASFALGRYEQAIQWAQRAMREKLGMNWAYRDLAVFYAHAGKIDEARKALAEFVATRPHATLSSVGEALQFMEPRLLKRYVDGLRIAGLAA